MCAYCRSPMPGSSGLENILNNLNLVMTDELGNIVI